MGLEAKESKEEIEHSKLLQMDQSWQASFISPGADQTQQK